MLGVTVMCTDPLEDVSGAAQQLLGKVGGHLRLQPVNLHLLSALCICHCLKKSRIDIVKASHRNELGFGAYSGAASG